MDMFAKHLPDRLGEEQEEHFKAHPTKYPDILFQLVQLQSNSA